MVRTSSVAEPKKKKIAEQEEMIERSNIMDKKVLDKRKKEEAEEILQLKEVEERNLKEEMLRKKEVE